MLAKEECIKALDRRKEAYENVFKASVIERDNEFYEDIDTIEQLINEHFDNPPLKFEELKEDMWVWDIKNAGWVCFDRPIANVAYCKMLSGLVIFFEENRFYRKQVQEDD